MLDRVKALAGEDRQEEDFNDEDDTSDDSGQSSQNESESEDDTSKTDGDDEVSKLRAENEKLRTERENYKSGMLAAKAKKRSIDPNEAESPKADPEKTTILKVLQEENERKVLKETINPDSSAYIPELVDDKQYREIIGYLPRNFDKSSEAGIVKALKMATKLWKEEKGIGEQSQKVAINDTQEPKSGKNNVQTTERKRILPKQKSYKSWY